MKTAAQKGYVRVLVGFDVDVSIDTIRQQREALASQFALMADALLKDLGPDALTAGFLQNGLGQVGIYVTPAGLEKLRSHPNVRSLDFDGTESQRASVYDGDHEIAAIDRQIDEAGYADVEVVLNLDTLAFTLAEGSKTVFDATPEVHSEVAAVLPKFAASLTPEYVRFLDKDTLEPRQRLRITREGLYELKEHPLLRSIRRAGERTRLAVELDPDALDRAKERGFADVLIALDAPDGYSPWQAKFSDRAWAVQAERLAKTFDEVLATFDEKEVLRLQRFEGMPLVVADVSLAGLERLYKAPDVRIRSVRLNKPIAQVHLAQSTARVNMPQAWNKGYTAAGQMIAIIDTGVAKNHPFLWYPPDPQNPSGLPKVVYEACFSSPSGVSYGNAVISLCPNPDSNGDSPLGMSGSADWALNPLFAANMYHGTHVAGIAAGVRGWSGLSGIAPDAAIIAVQVFTGHAQMAPDGTLSQKTFTAYDVDILKALQAIADLPGTSAEITINTSLGTLPGFLALCTQPTYYYYVGIKNETTRLISKKIPVVAATGNANPAGSGGQRDNISMPACLAGVIKVAATYDTSDTVWADSHTVNPSTLGQGETILLAPGCTITSATWPTTPSSTLGACGTSLAAPHVSGLYAVLKTAVPGAEVGDLSAWILANGVNVPVPGAGYSIKRIHVPNL